MMLIGITGHAQHGKSSAGQVLVERHGFTQYAFADQLKSMALALNPIVQSYKFPRHPERLAYLVGLLGWEKAKEVEEVRRFLQVLGTEGVREHLGENSWVRALELKLVNEGKLLYSYDPADGYVEGDVVVTDVRFPNESGWIHDMGGEVWRVKRIVRRPFPIGPDEDPKSHYKPFNNGLGKNHPSEQYIDDLIVDQTLVASNLDELAKEVERAWYITSKMNSRAETPEKAG